MHRDKNAALNIGRIFLASLRSGGTVPLNFRRTTKTEDVPASRQYRYTGVVQGPGGKWMMTRELVAEATTGTASPDA